MIHTRATKEAKTRNCSSNTHPTNESSAENDSTQMMISLPYSFQHETNLGQSISEDKNHCEGYDQRQEIPNGYFQKLLMKTIGTCRWAFFFSIPNIFK